VAGDGSWELALFALYNRLQEAGTRLLVAARVPPAQTGVRLPDLASRLEAGARYGLIPLDERGCARLLGAAAEQRGLRLDRAAVGYILRRVPRDPERLLSLIDELDRSTLQRQRAPTVRLIGELLVGHTPGR
jgi:DnaA family protein